MQMQLLSKQGHVSVLQADRSRLRPISNYRGVSKIMREERTVQW